MINAFRRRSFGHSAAGHLLAAVGLLAGPGSAMGIDQLRMSVERIQGTGWSIEGVEVGVDLNASEGPRLTVSVDGLRIADSRVRAARLTCRLASLGPRRWTCAQGRWRMGAAGNDRVIDGRAHLVYRAQTRHWHVRLRAADAATMLELDYRPSSNKLSATLETDSLAAVHRWLPDGWRPPIASMSGGMQAELAVTPGEAGHTSVAVDLHNVGFDTADGTIAGAGVNAELGLELAKEAGRRHYRLDARVTGGELLAGAFYVPQAEAPVHAALSGALSEDWLPRTLTLELSDPEAVSAQAQAVLAPQEGSGIPSLRTVTVTDMTLRFPGAYRRYLAGATAAKGLGQQRLSGVIAGQGRWSQQGLESIALEVKDFDIEDEQKRFALYRLQGLLSWSHDGQRRSRIDWQGGQVYRLPFGRGELALASAHGSVRQLRPLRLPIFDGALVVDDVQLHGLAGGARRMTFAARVEPISLSPLSRALGWPKLRGSLSGRIPGVRLNGDELVADGALLVNAFGGELAVRGLAAERLFGVLPRLSADIELRALDLGRLTDAFRFGAIEGTLEGHVRGLRLLDWSPVQFDARLATPPDDPVDHRISQRAVATLSRIGGGGAANALSRGFLSLFEDFGYKRLGIQCRLHDNICHMSGVEPVDNGYYLVKGRGLPRVDVIGYARQVDWPTLLEQLRQATQSGGAEVGRGPREAPSLGWLRAHPD